VFLGTTRDHFENRKVSYLSYEAYEDMAIASLQEIVDKVS
jgi:molybdopterin synthase catalytic subunit